MVTPAGEASHRFVALDSLRGIAALGVAWHHIIATNGPASWALLRNGGLFVDFFFVLSGFVIAATYGDRLAQGFSLLRYAVLRLGRVWPLHLVMVLAGLALELLSLLVGQHGLAASPPFTGLRDPLHLFTAVFLLDGLIPGWTNYYSRASWSISVEVLLYALSALAFRFGRTGLALLGLAALLAAGGLVVGVEAPIATFSVQRGLTGFVLGMACWHLYRRGIGARLRNATFLEVITLGALFAVIAWPPTPYATLTAIIPSALVVLVYARQQGRISQLLCANPWVWLGQISYALYMVHAMVKGRAIDVLVLLSRETGVPMAEWAMDGESPVKQLVLAPIPSTLVQMAIIAMMLFAAHWAHRLIEEPARLASRRLATRV